MKSELSKKDWKTSNNQNSDIEAKRASLPKQKIQSKIAIAEEKETFHIG